MSLVLTGFTRTLSVQASEDECVAATFVGFIDATLSFGRDSIGCYHIRRLVWAFEHFSWQSPSRLGSCMLTVGCGLG